ncbi:proton-conducting transporter membrane subunit [Campylobacter gastrosuis]|uniref:NADH:quinone oxidoreductase/Mrp antiporter transmembrane domain-containing protein n=1 Tax=Campylobacter gastrosuis TaxID=2974576 RepID=A0ABT7HQW6_9BACT|nr:proton-conducting transporter membrane subunit [Campylobacter gastrosuis]MDL0089013.1 hypothetical protein [Campylobacter gastrosuis]
MSAIFLLFFLLSLASLAIYNRSKNLALYVGFGGGAVASLLGAIFFASNLYSVNSFALFGNFLTAPHFVAYTLENFFCLIILVISFFTGIYSLGYVKNSRVNLGVFGAVFNSFILSMLMVMTSANIFAFIVFWEVMTLVSAFFMYLNDHEEKNTLTAVMTYLGFSQIGAFFIIVAFVIMSAASGGSYEFKDFIGLKFSPEMNFVLLILFFIGFGGKAGVWPLHVWLALAHPAAPSNASAMMSGIMTKVAIFALIKFSIMLNITTTFAYIVIFFGACSAVFGILYGAVDNDYKRAVAYSSVENIGIISVALGVGYFGIAKANGFIAIIGFLAAFFHIINHATFKSMLFFAVGAVLNATHTRNLNQLGGLHKKMPITSYAFLVGAIAICAVPPLNGFMSEWVLYQGLIASSGEPSVMARAMMVLAMLSIGVAGALAVMMFIRVYSAIFLGKERDEKIYSHAKEADKTMLFSIVILASFCVIFGLGSIFVLGFLLEICANIFGFGINLSSIKIINAPSVLFVLGVVGLIACILLILYKANLSKPRITEPWACGFRFDTNMQISSNPFSGDLRRVLKFFYRTEAEVSSDGYFGKVVYKSRIKEIWWAWFYEPVVNFCVKFADKIGIVQCGKSNIYALYTLIYMAFCLVGVYYFF